jgi:hypothetical protein
MKVSADQKTKSEFNLTEDVDPLQAPTVIQEINKNKEYKAKIENQTLVVKRLIRD